MAEPVHGESAPDEAALAIVARHALHDEELIAALAGMDPDLGEADATRARALIERCPTCRDLHADLVTIGAAIKASGTAAEVAAVRSAPRDFRLTPAMTGLARPASPLARLSARFAAAFAGVGRPLGVSFAALGIVGLLLGSFGLGFQGGTLAGGAGATQGEGAGEDNPGAYMGPVSSDRAASDRSAALPSATPGPVVTNPDASGGSGSGAAAVQAWLVVGSIVLLAVGVLLVVASGRNRSRAAP